MQPLMSWDAPDNGPFPKDLIARKKFVDKRSGRERFLAEVRRTPVYYQAALCIFDHWRGDEEVKWYKVPLSIGSIEGSGPSGREFEDWTKLIEDFIDFEYKDN